MIFTQYLRSSLNTKNSGELFSKVLAGGDIVLFSGELGAGKTTFISGIAEGLKVKETLSSPSFTIINIYDGHRKNKRYKIVHADFYRLDSIDEILNTGIEDYIYNENSISLIEWGDKIKSYLRKDFMLIDFDYDLKNQTSRTIKFEADNNYWAAKLLKFKKMAGK